MEVTQDDLKRWEEALNAAGLSQRAYELYMGVDVNKAMDEAFKQVLSKPPLPTPQKPKSMHDVNAATKAAISHVKKVNRDSKFGMGQIQEKDFLRGVQWMMQVYFEKNSILVWTKFSQAEPTVGTTILSRYEKDHAYDYSLMKYGDNDFKRSVLISVDAEWSTVEASNNDWWSATDWTEMNGAIKSNSSGIMSSLNKMP